MDNWKFLMSLLYTNYLINLYNSNLLDIFLFLILKFKKKMLNFNDF